ncbi:hypothetical protein FHR33_004454 [Nonomuraea dietziae]|uniref:Uncharacterized protein n=1 Tax=Nonomuraea dietziae TaxID=65515 RepID=A0A7W5V404_9ACTN|nr:hypothetical protein [Nonomuraea dietziae]
MTPPGVAASPSCCGSGAGAPRPGRAWSPPARRGAW